MKAVPTWHTDQLTVHCSPPPFLTPGIPGLLLPHLDPDTKRALRRTSRGLRALVDETTRSLAWRGHGWCKVHFIETSQIADIWVGRVPTVAKVRKIGR